MTDLVQLILLGVNAAIFGAAFFAAISHMRKVVATQDTPNLNTQSMGALTWVLIVAGITVAAGLLVWRAFGAGHLRLVLSSHYDAFLMLGLMLAALLLYFHWSKHLRSLAFFFLPMIALVLLIGCVLSAVSAREYDYQNVWTKVHVVTVIFGALCFAVGCIGAGAYLIAARQLKRRGSVTQTKPRFLFLPPLATIERFNQTLVYLGFPLLTVAMIAGFVRTWQEPRFTQGFALGPKVMIAIVAWLIYAVLMHVPLTPAIRGRRAAWLSVTGFGLVMGVYVAVLWMK